MLTADDFANYKLDIACASLGNQVSGWKMRELMEASEQMGMQDLQPQLNMISMSSTYANCVDNPPSEEAQNMAILRFQNYD